MAGSRVLNQSGQHDPVRKERQREREKKEREEGERERGRKEDRKGGQNSPLHLPRRICTCTHTPHTKLHPYAAASRPSTAILMAYRHFWTVCLKVYSQKPSGNFQDLVQTDCPGNQKMYTV